MEECPLCKHERLTKHFYEDEICWVALCKSHPDKKIAVLNRHTREPTLEEERYVREVMERLFPGIKLRDPKSILNHWHLHEI